MTIDEFLHVVKVLCLLYDASVTSWYRTEQRNAAVGGHPHSRHKRFLGIDVVVDDARQIGPLCKAAVKAGLSALDEGDHIHLQTTD